MRRMMDKYPNVLLETCSGQWGELPNPNPSSSLNANPNSDSDCLGGGGRFDLGMLAYSHQIWTSDNTDAISRMKA